MSRIIPHLWYDKEALEAARLYVTLFEDSQVTSHSVLHDTPSGDAVPVNFVLAGQPFAAISAGPMFRLNPSVSLMVECGSPEEVDRLHSALVSGGAELMELGEYPFAQRYAWLQDRFGLSWQLMYRTTGAGSQKITPCLLFSGDVCGKAEDAAQFYSSLFPGSGIGFISRYAPGEAALPEARVNYMTFSLDGFGMVAMDNGYPADFAFNEAFSFMIPCDTQEEIDAYWDKLSHVPEAEACGWAKDRYGVSWQIIPSRLGTMMSGPPEATGRVVEAFMKMKKFDLAALEKAFRGE